MENSRTIRSGDVITSLRHSYTVNKILYQDWYGPREAVPPCSDCWGYDVEFIDTDGHYHHWKQNQDGGHVDMLPREPITYADIFGRSAVLEYDSGSLRLTAKQANGETFWRSTYRTRKLAEIDLECRFPGLWYITHE